MVVGTFPRYCVTGIPQRCSRADLSAYVRDGGDRPSGSSGSDRAPGFGSQQPRLVLVRAEGEDVDGAEQGLQFIGNGHGDLLESGIPRLRGEFIEFGEQGSCGLWVGREGGEQEVLEFGPFMVVQDGIPFGLAVGGERGEFVWKF